MSDRDRNYFVWGFCARRMWLKFVWQPKPPGPGLNVHVRCASGFLQGKRNLPAQFPTCIPPVQIANVSQLWLCARWCILKARQMFRTIRSFFSGLLLCARFRQMCWLFPVCTHSSSLHVYELSIAVPFLFHSGARCRDNWLRGRKLVFRNRHLHLRAYILPHRARSNLFITLRAIPGKSY